MSVRLHRKLLKSGYPWELGMREHEGGFLLLTLHTSISSEFFYSEHEFKHYKCSKKQGGGLVTATLSA